MAAKRIKGPSKQRIEQLMREQGLLQEGPGVNKSKPIPSIIRDSWGESRASEPIIEPPPQAEECPVCSGRGCNEKAVRIDDQHWCVRGLKLNNRDAYQLKLIHLHSADKQHFQDHTLPALLLLKKHLNVDLGNADVRQHTPAQSSGDGRAHEGSGEKP